MKEIIKAVTDTLRELRSGAAIYDARVVVCNRLITTYTLTLEADGLLFSHRVSIGYGETHDNVRQVFAILTRRTVEKINEQTN